MMQLAWHHFQTDHYSQVSHKPKLRRTSVPILLSVNLLFLLCNWVNIEQNLQLLPAKGMEDEMQYEMRASPPLSLSPNNPFNLQLFTTGLLLKILCFHGNAQ